MHAERTLPVHAGMNRRLGVTEPCPECFPVKSGVETIRRQRGAETVMPPASVLPRIQEQTVRKVSRIMSEERPTNRTFPRLLSRKWLAVRMIYVSLLCILIFFRFTATALTCFVVGQFVEIGLAYRSEIRRIHERYPGSLSKRFSRTQAGKAGVSRATCSASK
jgi:hypothetical protein